MAAKRAALALAGAAVLLGLAPTAAAQAELIATDTNVANPRYEPATLDARGGMEIAVRNTGSDRHTVTSVDGAWPEVELGAGEREAFVAPSREGAYRFYCRYHASAQAPLGQGMVGELRVGRLVVDDKPAPLGAELAALALLAALVVARRPTR